MKPLSSNAQATLEEVDRRLAAPRKIAEVVATIHLTEPEGAMIHVIHHDRGTTLAVSLPRGRHSKSVFGLTFDVDQAKHFAAAIDPSTSSIKSTE